VSQHDHKQAVIQAVIAALQQDLDGVMAAAHAAREGATHAEVKPENDKDTRAIEAGYLAGAHAARVQQLQSDLRFLRNGADALRMMIVDETTKGGSMTHRYLLSAWGAGLRVDVDGPVVVVSPQSPRGKALLGKKVNDDVDVVVAGRRVSLTITALF
jgi:hypothetical protein